jgi:hypothetical protein
MWHIARGFRNLPLSGRLDARFLRHLMHITMAAGEEHPM